MDAAEGHVEGVGEELLVVHHDKRDDLFLHDMGCAWSTLGPHVVSKPLTPVAGLGSNLRKKLDKVRQIVAEEFGAYDKVLPGVGGNQGTTKQLRLALYPQRCPPVGVL